MHGRPRAFWEQLVAPVEAGANLHVVAQRHGVNASTLAWWRAVFRREGRVATPRLLPVVVRDEAVRTAQASAASPVELELVPGGATPPLAARDGRPPRRGSRASTWRSLLTPGSSSRVFLAAEPIELRRGHDGLCAAVRATPGRDPHAGDLLACFGRRAHGIKVLHWLRGGFIGLCGRLEQGRFRLPRIEDGAREVVLDGTALTMLLDGLDLRCVRRPTHWEASRPSGEKGGQEKEK